MSFTVLQCIGLASAVAQTPDNQPQPPQPSAAGDVQPAAVRKLTAEGMSALSAGKLPQALQKLEQAYVAAPSLAGLYQLGRIAEARGRSVPAADLYRRYLTAAGLAVDEQVKAELRRYITRIKEPTAEVDVASGDVGAILRLDGEVAGVLPLSGPLLVTAGEHRFAIEKKGQQFQTRPQLLPPGQRAQLQVTLESRYAVLTLTPALVLLVAPAGLEDGVQAQLVAAVAEAAQMERSFLIDREQTRAALIRASAGRRLACAGDRLCEEGLARQVDAAGVLTIKAQAAGAQIGPVSVQLLDVPTGMLVGETGEICDSCSASAATDAVLRATRKLLQSAATRGRGTLQVASVVAGAKVLVDGRELGTTPLSREAFEGPHEIVVQQDGYVPYKTMASVTRGQTAAVQATLQEAKKPDPAPAVRPRWRFIAGGISIGAGLTLAGFGASALAAQGSCVDVPMAPAQLCDNLYATNGVGGALVGTGAALTIGGIVLMAWPAK